MAKKDFMGSLGQAKTDKSLAALIRGNPRPDELQLSWIPHEKIYSVKQVRFKFTDIESLAASMKGKQQEEAIRVFPADKDGKHRIHVGERRWRAAKHNDEPVLAIIDNNLDIEVYNAKNIIRQIAENDQREQLTPIELGKGFALLRDDFAMSTAAIAESFGRKPAYISKHLKLLEMPEMVQSLLEDGVVTYIETLNILTAIYALSPQECESYVAEIREQGEAKRSEAQERLNVLKGKTPKQKPDQDTATGVQDPNTTDQDIVPGEQEPDTTGQHTAPDVQGPNTTGKDTALGVQNPDTTGQDTALGVQDPDTTDQDIAQSVQYPDTTGQDIAPDVQNPDTAGQHTAADVQFPDTTGQDTAPGVQDLDTTGQDIAPVVQGPDTTATNTPIPSSIASTGHITVIVLIDGVEHELLDKPSVIDGDDEMVFVTSPNVVGELQVPVSECKLHKVTLTK